MSRRLDQVWLESASCKIEMQSSEINLSHDVVISWHRFIMASGPHVLMIATRSEAAPNGERPPFNTGWPA